MKKIIKLTESDLHKIVTKVLNEQLANVVDTPEEIMDFQKDLVRLGYNLGKTGPTKNGVDGIIGKRTKSAIKNFQKASGLPVTGKLDQTTQNTIGYADEKNYRASTKEWNQKLFTFLQRRKNKSNWGTEKQWDDYNKKRLSTNDSNKQKITKTKQPTIDSGDCVGLDKKSCDRVSSTNVVTHGDAGTSQCAAYVTKCLSEYDKLYIGDAWKAAANIKAKGTEKYNLFTSDLDWNKIFSELKKEKITKTDCVAFYGKAHSDYFTFKGKSNFILDLVLKNIPSKSSVNLSSLKPGDIVGLWHKNTKNKGRAFCERLVDDLKLDDKGNFKQLPFTFNTHVGFVTAIKNGVPIIAHNVEGTYYTIPATKMLSKSNDDMIVWVVSDPEVEKAIASRAKKTSTPKTNQQLPNLGVNSQYFAKR